LGNEPLAGDVLRPVIHACRPQQSRCQLRGTVAAQSRADHAFKPRLRRKSCTRWPAPPSGRLT
jgi:hypothetical protein